MRLSHVTAANTPAMDVYYKFNHDILRMPGVRSMAFYGEKRPNELGINVVDARAAAAVSAVLEPTLDGVALNIYTPDSREPYTGPGGALRDRIAIIDAMTGVWDHSASILHRGNGTVTFKTIGQDVISRLDPLLRNRYHMGYDSHGWTIWVNVKWKAGVPAQKA